MAQIERPAVKVIQGNLTLYLTFLTPRDLFEGNFYRVETLEPTNRVGFQRILDESRAKRLERHLKEAVEHGYAHLPTTVFLATDKDLTFDSESGLLTFDTEEVGPFSVVDGQHRIEGLRRASSANEEFQDFPLPTTIATGLDSAHQMYHFYIVNTTQVPVDPALRQQITRQFTDMQGVDDLPYFPHWLERQVQEGRDARAIRIVEALNNDSSSPLAGRIQMANTAPIRHGIKQSSLVNIIKSQVLSPANPLVGQETDVGKQARIMVNYLHAIDELLVDGRDRTETRIYNNNGLYFAFGISRWVFNRIYSTTRDCTVNSLKACLAEGFSAMDEQLGQVAVGNADWWMPGQFGADSINRASATMLINRFQAALASTGQGAAKL